jgi:hypothetical protein
MTGWQCVNVNITSRFLHYRPGDSRGIDLGAVSQAIQPLALSIQWYLSSLVGPAN